VVLLSDSSWGGGRVHLIDCTKLIRACDARQMSAFLTLIVLTGRIMASISQLCVVAGIQGFRSDVTNCASRMVSCDDHVAAARFGGA
jgi:hypothetical protein